MDEASRFRKDLFRGTAEYYDRFRLPYPDALLDDLRARVPLDRHAKVLDLACGTGQIAFALAPHVAQVHAVDQEPELVEYARRKAQRLGVSNIAWIVAAAESLSLADMFDLVAIGNAFHRLDRDAVARRVHPYVQERGAIALVWSETPWEGTRPWQVVLKEVLDRWQDAAGARDRVPPGWAEAIEEDPHRDVLERAGFAYAARFDVMSVQRWTVETLTGFMYSTSFLNRVALGPHAEAFERDLRHRLINCCPDGTFVQDSTSTYELARRRH